MCPLLYARLVRSAPVCFNFVRLEMDAFLNSASNLVPCCGWVKSRRSQVGTIASDALVAASEMLEHKSGPRIITASCCFLSVETEPRPNKLQYRLIA